MSRPCCVRVLLICIGLLAGNAAAQTQPAAGSPAAAPTTPQPTTTAAAPIPDPQTPQEFFARARQLSDLEASGIPFHLKATYIASGDTEFTGNGTYEVWWQSKDIWRKEATLGDYKYVVIENSDKLTSSATDAYMPLRVREVMGLQIFHIAMAKGDKDEWKMSQENGRPEMQEIATMEKPCDLTHPNFVCSHEFAFNGEGVLQLYRVNDLRETYTDLHLFGKLIFPREIAVTLQGDTLLTVNIESLEALADHGRIDPQTDSDLRAVPSQLIEEIPAKGVIPPKIIHNVRTKYPKSERKHHPNRLVIIACTIDATGAVREPYVQLSGGAAFDQAAIKAVRQYRFKPAIKNGEPAMVDTNVIINFRVF